ncbi:MAG: hypothetical protein H6644_04880 [Caldilineaceae bacterium]|nr:hypothetical protein [Caldilineaceae bacterium]
MIDTEIVQEILFRFGAIERWQTGVQLATNLLALTPSVLPVTVGEMETAVTLFGRYGPSGVKARDVVHAARHLIPEIASFPPTNILIKSKGSSASIR